MGVGCVRRVRSDWFHPFPQVTEGELRLKSRTTLIASLAAFALVAASESLAVPITVPTGLNPGDQYRLAFVTSTTRDATSSNIADYNAFVTAVANAVPELLALGTTWTAIGSTPTVDARDNTNTNPFVAVGFAIYLLNDTLLANDNADLWDLSIANPLEIDEGGNTTPNLSAWTGTFLDGTAAAGGELGTPGPIVGFTHTDDADWILAAQADWTAVRAFYALSDTIMP